MPSRSNLENRAYGTPIRPAVRTGPVADRKRPGEADPATRRRMLDQRLNERQPPSSAPPARAKREPGEATGVSPNAARLLRDRGLQIDREVDKNSR